MGLSRPFSVQTKGAKQQLPADCYGTLDAATAYKCCGIPIPPGAKAICVLSTSADLRGALLSTLTDGTTVLANDTSFPLPSNTWFQIDVGQAGNGDADQARPTTLFIGGATVSAPFWALALPSAS